MRLRLMHYRSDDTGRGESKDASSRKHFRFAYQDERGIWLPQKSLQQPLEVQDVEVGSTSDIAELIVLEE